MFLSSKILSGVGLVAFLATGTTLHAASTNPWALHPQQPPAQTQGQAQGQGQGQGNMQGSFNMGGGFTLGGAGQPQANVAPPQFVAPQPVMPAQPARPAPTPQNTIPAPTGQQFGIYPPLSSGNTQTLMITPKPRQQMIPQAFPSYNYGQAPYGFNPGYGGFNPGYGGFGFPGFGGFPGFNGFNNFGFGFGFGGGLVAPGPVFPGYVNPYYQNNQNFQQPRYQVRPGGAGN